MWPVLEEVPCTAGKNVYYGTVGLKVLYISLRSIWSIVLINSVSLGIFCLVDLSIAQSGVLKYPITIVFESMSPFSFLNISFK